MSTDWDLVTEIALEKIASKGGYLGAVAVGVPGTFFRAGGRKAVITPVREVLSKRGRLAEGFGASRRQRRVLSKADRASGGAGVLVDKGQFMR